MAPSSKLTFKITLISNAKHPFRVISVPEGAPFAALERYSAENFDVSPNSVALRDRDGFDIESTMVGDI